VAIPEEKKTGNYTRHLFHADTEMNKRMSGVGKKFKSMSYAKTSKNHLQLCIDLAHFPKL
jgi:hypothetical protein